MSNVATIDIDQFSPEERLALIQRLRESLDTQSIPLTLAQVAELDRRLATADKDLADSVPWETLRAELGSRRR